MATWGKIENREIPNEGPRSEAKKETVRFGSARMDAVARAQILAFKPNRHLLPLQGLENGVASQHCTFEYPKNSLASRCSTTAVERNGVSLGLH